jgi:methylase of polypeptide subunit release factors
LNHAAELLKCYLDESGFDGIFKYLSALNFYYLTPARINSLCEITSESVDRIVDKGSDRWELLKCCMLMKEIPFSSLDTQEKRVAEALIESDFLQLKDGIVSNAGYQLISHRGQYLFIDARINYRHLGRHEVYIGFDTYLMLYYIETGRISRNNRCLDLCTGSGIAGLVLSDYAENVVATDIAEQPLKLSRFNCHLNAKENRLTIKNENFVDTLCKKEKYDFVTCNPPFVAFPKDLEAPIFARGYDFDGLGHYRMLFSKIRNYVNENGAAYFVSDLIGDENEPYFVSELKKYAMDIGLQIDLFIDNRLDAKYQLVGYPPFLK